VEVSTKVSKTFLSKHSVRIIVKKLENLDKTNKNNKYKKRYVWTDLLTVGQPSWMNTRLTQIKH